MRRVLAGAAMCVLGVLGSPAAAGAQTTPGVGDEPLTAPGGDAPTATTPPDAAATPLTVVGGGRTSIADVTFSLDLGATTVAGDATPGGDARGTIRFDQDVHGPGISRSGVIAQVRCVSTSGKQATIVGQVTRGTGAFDHAQSITLLVEDNGEPVQGRPVDRFGSTVSDDAVPATCPLAGAPAPVDLGSPTPVGPVAPTPVDLGAVITEGNFVVSTATPSAPPTPSTQVEDTPTTSTTPTTPTTSTTSTPSGGGAVSGP